MAWCVGSVFPNPQLINDSVVALPSSLFLDPPEYLLSTGCAFPCVVPEQSDPHHQVECVLDEFKEAFFPKELLIKNLQEDMPLHPEISQSSCAVGNQLEGVKNREGRLHIFFPVGENTDRIGSCILLPESSAPFSGRKLCCANNNNLQYTTSSSVRQPILQIGANKIGSFWDSELSNVPLAARTLYQVHWLTSQIENDINSVAWRGVESFNYGTSHVVWNPHFPGETAVLLENGDVTIYDLNAPGSPITSSIYKVEEGVGNEDFNFFNCGSTHKRKRKKETVQSSRSNDSVHTLALKNWWTCEYAWHPKNLLVGGRTQIVLVDMRQKHGSKQFQSSMARVDCSSGLFSYCNLMHTTEVFTALARADYDNMSQFAAATTNHLSLYDVRRPNTPLLQWEHRMQDEPPRLLQMYCLSDVCPRFHDLHDKLSVGGRVILACSYKSGEIRAFSYGPKPSMCPSTLEGIKLDWSNTGGTLDKLYSWEFPKTLTCWKGHRHKNLEHAFEAHENNLQTFFRKGHTAQQLTGLLGFSPKAGSSSFTILQLTRSGLIFSQSLKLSEEMEFSNYDTTGGVSEKRAVLRRNSGKCKTKHYRMESFPAFLNYLKHGQHKKLYSRVSDFQKSTSANQDNRPKKETEKVHGSTLVNEAQGSMIRKPTTCSRCTVARLQSSESDNKDDKNTEGFLSKMDSQLSPVILSFTDTANGTNLQSEELHILSGLKDLFQHWQQSFQPYIDHSSLDVNNDICESCRIPL